MSTLKPRNFQFKERTKAAKLNASLYVFTPLRDLNVRNMHIAEREIPRCQLVLIETFPEIHPSYQALVESGQLVFVEEMIPALYQIETLQEAFKKEGLTAVDCDYDVAVELQSYLESVKGLSLLKAIEFFYENVKDENIRQILVDSFRKSYDFAMGVLGTSRREIQSARSGRKGKSFIDRRDSLFCRLTDTTELSILAPEGAAAQNTIKDVAAALKAAIQGDRNVEIADMSVEASTEMLQEVLALMKSQGAEIDRLKAQLEGK